jgi:Phage terminase, small subunit
MGEEKKTGKKKLTAKEKAFIAAYLGAAHFNGTEAAAQAGYRGTRATLGQIAYENLRKPEIKAEIDTALSAMTMPANAVLTRLTEIAEGKVTDFLDENKNFDLEKAKKAGKDHLIKKIKIKRAVKQKTRALDDSMRSFLADDEINEIETETEILHEEVEFELYSAHDALRDLGKYHKLFTDKTEITGGDGRDLIPSEIILKIDKIYGAGGSK